MSGNTKKKVKSKTDPKREAIEEGYKLLRKHPIFRYIMHDYRLDITNKERLGKESAAISDSNGHICLNKDMSLSPAEWAYTIAHCMLHNVFGHFDGEKMPGYEKKTLTILKRLHRQMSSLPS